MKINENMCCNEDTCKNHKTTHRSREHYCALFLFKLICNPKAKHQYFRIDRCVTMQKKEK